MDLIFILSSLAINMKNNLNILSASWTTADLEMILDHLVLWGGNLKKKYFKRKHALSTKKKKWKRSRQRFHQKKARSIILFSFLIPTSGTTKMADLPAREDRALYGWLYMVGFSLLPTFKSSSVCIRCIGCPILLDWSDKKLTPCAEVTFTNLSFQVTEVVFFVENYILIIE